MSDSSGEDRRRRPRAGVLGTAVLTHGEHLLGPYTVQNLSASGVLITGSHDVHRGERVRVVLHLSQRRVLTIEGTVVRRGKSLGTIVSLGIHFEHESADVEDEIQDLVLQALVDQTAPSPVSEPAPAL